MLVRPAAEDSPNPRGADHTAGALNECGCERLMEFTGVARRCISSARTRGDPLDHIVRVRRRLTIARILATFRNRRT
jgi:hypothetical protein